jgi:polo-like kinase 1
VPVTAHDSAPDFRRLTITESRRNLQAVYHKAKIGAPSEINTETGRIRTNLGPSIIQQERDFKYAVQPDSPLGALIK